ncbi:MAG: aminotransferase class V-fold PLP-dependent enzyme [Candidatus Krumholzibacteriia bacterium]
MLRDLFLLRDDVVFLNHGSFGACPRPVFDEYQRLQRELEAEPVDFLSTRRTLPARLAAARAELAAYLGADRDELVFVTNATTALNVAARSLCLEPGDEVLSTDHEYGALDRMWRFLCGRQGARYVQQTLPVPLHHPDDVVEAVWSGVTARTKVLFLSQITSPSGVVLPVAPLVARARDRGILTMIDGAHAPGQIPCDLHALGCDIWAGNCHKWLLAPKGPAALYVRREVQERIEPLVVSWGWQSDHPGPSRFIDEQEWTGTRDPSAFLAVPAALAFLREHDWLAVRARCHELLLEGRQALLELTGLPALCPPEPWLAQMCAVPLPEGVDGDALHRRLREEFKVEVPVTSFAGRPWLRFSVQGYNSRGDLGRLVEAVGRALG